MFIRGPKEFESLKNRDRKSRHTRPAALVENLTGDVIV